MNVVLAFASVDGQDAAARLTALLTTLGVAVVEPGPDAASAPVIALLTPAALRGWLSAARTHLTPLPTERNR